MSELRPIDGNGHVPDEDLCADCIRRESPEYQAGYQQALIDLIFAMVGKMHDDLTAVLEKVAA